MLNWIERTVVRATKPIKPADTTITIPRKDAVQLNKVGTGNHMFLTLALYGAPNVFEIVRYDHTKDVASTGCIDVAIVVTRDVNGTGMKAFPIGTCAVAELSSVQLKGIIEAKTNERFGELQ